MGRKIKQFISLDQTELPFTKRDGFWAAAHPLERKAVPVLAVCVLLCSAVYMYFVMTSVMDVAARETLSMQATKLSAEVASLEAQYLSRTNSITEAYARAHGFVSLSDRSFIQQANGLSLNTAR